jgi:hypothetical protein
LTSHVQNDIPDGSAFIDAKTVLIAAGPSKLSQLSGRGGSGVTNLDVAYPIGCMENLSVNQTKTVQRIFEIGSIRSYFVPGRVIGQAAFGRSLYNGRSLANVLYAVANTSNGTALTGGAFQTLTGSTVTNLAIRSTPGYGNFFINMASDLFNYGFGLLIYMVDNALNPYGAVYLEDNYLQGHQFAVNSQATVIVEGTSSQFDLAVPVQLPSSSLAASENFLV